MLLTSVVVNNMTADVLYPQGSGQISLRNAIATANSSTTPTTITFDPTVFASAQTIALSNDLELSNTSQPTTITGPAAGVTVSKMALMIDSNVTANIAGITFWDASINNDGTAGLTNVTVSAHLGNEVCGISNQGGSMTLANVTVSDMFEGMINKGTATLTGATISDSFCCGILNYGGTMNVTDTTVSRNNAGGICNNGTVTLTGVTISDNTNSNDVLEYGVQGGQGGGIYNDGTATLTNVTISGNTALGAAGNNYGGGGIYNDTGGNATLTNVTVSNNVGTSSAGGGICNAAPAGKFTLANTIVAGNSADKQGPDAYGSFNSLGHNLIGETDYSSGWNGSDLTGTSASPLNPELGSLNDNGGPTQTMALLGGSPAIDAGSNSLAVDAGGNALTTDQRGLPRIVNGTVDIGAFELEYQSGSTWGPLFTFSAWDQAGSIDGTTDWDQYCPLDPENGDRCLTGCVATAEAQVLYHWRFPQSIAFSTSDSYTSQGPDGSINIDADSATYDFPSFSTLNTDLSSITYDGSAEEESLLSFAVGIKTQMNYSDAGSAALATNATFAKFGFESADISDDWNAVESTVISNIESNQPVLLYIDCTSDWANAHEVVVDGYNSCNNTFHVDLGWGPGYGNANGNNDWYSLPTIDAGGISFNNICGLIYDIEPTLPSPTGVMASQGSYSDHVHLTWNAAEATGYEVWRGTTNDPTAASLITSASLTGTSYDDTTANNAQPYYYWIQSQSQIGGSGLGSSVEGYLGNATPPTVSAYNARNVTTAGGTTETFTVTYADSVAVNVSTLDSNDVLVTGPNGYSQL
ncbi:MAG: C10 family peptidase, partial [Thermoguttaceae bacterium]